MNSQFFIKSCSALYLISTCGACTTAVTKDTGKAPNIIFILTDDHRWDAMGYAGNTVIQTPEMDRLAQEGTFFRYAFSSTPISAASRASIFTGMYERTHGYSFGPGKTLRQKDADISYPVILRENGYHTGFFGKFGVRYKGMKGMFDEIDSYDRGGAMNKKCYNYKTIDGDTVHLTQYTGYQGREFIKKAPKDKPFCLSLSFSAPHAQDGSKDQYFWQEKSNSRYAGITMPEPLLKEDHYFEEQPLPVRKGFNRVRWHWRYDTPEKYQHSIKGYYRMIQEIDDEIASIRKVLEEEGIADNTIIMLMGDNGLFLGERQFAGKWLMYEQSIRVPLLVYDPRAGSHHDVNDMVLNIDIPKTILDYAGVSAPERYQGISLKPYVDGETGIKPRENILIEHLWEKDQIPSSEGLRTEKWKYFRYRFIDAPEELYDLQSDPMEIRNLSKYDCYKHILDSLRNICDQRISTYKNQQ